MIRIETLTEITNRNLDYVKQLYVSSFPPDERRGFDELLRLIQECPRLTFNLIVKGDVPVGFLICWKLDDFIFLEHFAVDHHLRGRGIGQEVIRTWLSTLALPVVLEVEMPVHADQRRRVEFYQRLGFELYNVEYWQPPYSSDKRPVKMLLMGHGGIDVVGRLEIIKSALGKEVYFILKSGM